jgi:hypothetical protein
MRLVQRGQVLRVLPPHCADAIGSALMRWCPWRGYRNLADSKAYRVPLLPSVPLNSKAYLPRCPTDFCAASAAHGNRTTDADGNRTTDTGDGGWSRLPGTPKTRRNSRALAPVALSSRAKRQLENGGRRPIPWSDHHCAKSPRRMWARLQSYNIR